MHEIFNKELSYIKDERIRESLKVMFDKLPDYFYEVPASSTGKYHPAFSLGNMGLVRHTKVAVRIAYEFFNNPSICNFNDNEKDLILFALCVHDGLKSGKVKSEYTVFDHPLQISSYIKECKNEMKLTDDEINFVCSCVETHMGPWTTDYRGNDILEAPKSKYQRFVHMCDYLASRKFLDVAFENNEIIN